MLNPFPILFLSLLAYAVLRVVAGGILLFLGVTQLSRKRREALTGALWGGSGSLCIVWLVIILEFLAGLMFVAGFLTQFAAIGSVLISLSGLFGAKRLSGLIPDAFFYLLLFAVSLSLVITGAGAFAFDIPL